MASGFPKFRLYASNGVTLVYEFENVISIDDWADPFDYSEHISLRGQGSIISEGSTAPWDLNITFLLKGSGYQDLTGQISSLLSTIQKNTKYILKVDKTPSSTQDYKVKRLESFGFPLNNRQKRVNLQTVNLILRVGCWS